MVKYKGTFADEERKHAQELENYDLLQEYTYNEYNGSSAQDVMGFSDQEIDDAFDGKPDTYWNID